MGFVGETSVVPDEAPSSECRFEEYATCFFGDVIEKVVGVVRVVGLV
jgi:hypothetical protein